MKLALFAEKAYYQDCRRSERRPLGMFCGIMARAWKRESLTDKQKHSYRLYARIRVAIERVIVTL